MIAFFVTIISEIYFRKEATKYFSKFMICLLSSKVNNSANSWKTPKGKFGNFNEFSGQKYFEKENDLRSPFRTLLAISDVAFSR